MTGMLIPYLIYAICAYNKKITSNTLYFITIICVVFGNLVWSYSKTILAEKEYVLMRMIFESGAILLFILVPCVLYKVNLSMSSYVGLFFVLLGFIIFNINLFE